jgi:molybdate transport system substrate-binding protein
MKRFAWQFALAIAVGACASAGNAPRNTHTLTVFAAASLTESFKEIGAAFEKENRGVTVTFNFGGSQTLRAQLEQGAAADVFASADQRQMDVAIAGGVIAKDAAKVFATNQLVVITPQDNPAKIQALADLARPNLKIVLAAEAVPVGRYTGEALSKAGKSLGENFKQQVMKNVVSKEDNVKQVVAKVQLGEVDAGIVYRSDVVTASPVHVVPIPDDLNVVAQYPVARMSSASQKELADRFIAYLLSVNGQTILKKWGLGIP